MKKWSTIGEFNNVLDSSDKGVRTWWKATVYGQEKSQT